MYYIDSHGHFDDKAFDDDRDEVIAALKSNDVELFFNVGSDIRTSKISVELADKWDFIYAVIGVHPHDAKSWNSESAEILKELSKNKKVVAIGEVGLDFHYDFSPRDMQRECFKEQIILANELNLPLAIHSREAAQETHEILKSLAKTEVLLHCYTGSWEMAKVYLKEGYSLAIGGAVTFKNAKHVKEVAKNIPLENLLIETDCPYMTPEPYRGRRNEPKYMKHTVEYIAELRGISPEEVLEHTNANTKRFYRIEG